MTYLEKQFKTLWIYSRCTGDYRQGFQDLVEQYEKPKRYYHTFQGHIEFCIRAFFEHVVHAVQDPKVILWQLFLHDSVMDFHRNDNDVMSAEYAKKFLTKYDVNVEIVKNVVKAIVYHDHQKKPFDKDIAIGLDIDLLILAQSQDVFDEYENNIRKEYYFVSDNYFYKGRVKVLESFLQDRPKIFLTRHFYNRFEKQARKNLERSIEKVTR